MGYNPKLYLLHTYMNFQERYKPDIYPENQNPEAVCKHYFEMIRSGHTAALEFLDRPSNILQSERKKAKRVTHILSHKQTMQALFKKACDINFIKPKCAYYASFVATFSQQMNPNNETILFFGKAIISTSPKEDEIGTSADHFWTTINGEIFDNSNLGKYSYTNLQPILKTEDISSGNFKFEEVVSQF